VTAAIGEDCYTTDLTCVWRDPLRRWESRFALWDGQFLALRLTDDGTGGEAGRRSQRILVAGASMCNHGGAYLRTKEAIPADVEYGAANGTAKPAEHAAPETVRAVFDRTILPHFKMEAMSLDEVMSLLKKKRQEIFPAGDGPSIFLQLPPGPYTQAPKHADDDFGGGGDDFGDLEEHDHEHKRPVLALEPDPEVNLDLVQVTMGDAIRCLARQLGLRVRFEANALILAYPSVCLDRQETRYYAVSRDAGQFLRELRECFPTEPRPTPPPKTDDDDDDDDNDDNLLSLFRNVFGLFEDHNSRASWYPRTGKLIVHGEPYEFAILEGLLGILHQGGTQASLRFSIGPQSAPDDASGTHVEELIELVGALNHPLSLRHQIEVKEMPGLDALELSLTPALVRLPDTIEGEFTCRLMSGADGGTPFAETTGTLLLGGAQPSWLALPLVSNLVARTNTPPALLRQKAGYGEPAPPKTSSGGHTMEAPHLRMRPVPPPVGTGGRRRGMALIGIHVSGELVGPTGLALRRLPLSQLSGSQEENADEREKMRRRLDTVIVRDLTLDAPTAMEAITGLRNCVRRQAPDDSVSNLVAAAEVTTEGDEEAQRLKGKLDLSGLSVLAALDAIQERFALPYSILGTAVLIGGVRTERGCSVISAVPTSLLAGRPIETADGGPHAALTALLKENGVFFRKGDRALLTSAPTGVLVLGTALFRSQVERALTALSPPPIEMTVSAWSMPADSEQARHYTVTTIPGKTGSCTRHGQSASRLEITPNWAPGRSTVHLSVAWQQLSPGGPVLRSDVEVTLGEQTQLELRSTPDEGNRRTMPLTVAVTVNRR